MHWITLWKKLGRQPMHKMTKDHVYALLENPKTHRREQVPLCLRFDACGHPYLVREERKGKRK